MDEDAITTARIDELLRFLPPFEAAGVQFVVGSGGGQQMPDGATTMRYPIYSAAVLAFFRLAGQPWWSDYGYEPARAARMVADRAFIAGASLDEIKTMLTYCVRGERFADGHWLAMLESGRITALLRRLAVLRKAVAGPGLFPEE